MNDRNSCPIHGTETCIFFSGEMEIKLIGHSNQRSDQWLPSRDWSDGVSETWVNWDKESLLLGRGRPISYPCEPRPGERQVDARDRGAQARSRIKKKGRLAAERLVGMTDTKNFWFQIPKAGVLFRKAVQVISHQIHAKLGGIHSEGLCKFLKDLLSLLDYHIILQPNSGHSKARERNGLIYQQIFRVIEWI